MKDDPRSPTLAEIVKPSDNPGRFMAEQSKSELQASPDAAVVISGEANPSHEKHATELRMWRVTDVGMVRESNEDSSHGDSAAGVFVVADGMGGHAAGEVASAMTVESVSKSLTEARSQLLAFASSPTDSGRRAVVTLMQQAVLTAHHGVYSRGVAEPDLHGMGTTLDVLVIAGNEAFVAHVGDSRTYLVRDGELSQLTTDHTVAEVLLIEGKLTPEEAAVSPMRTVLVNAVGVSPEVGVEMAHAQLMAGDRLMLCSDGLHDYFPEEAELASKIAADPIDGALQAMVDLAKERGGHDNITGILIEVVAVRGAVPRPVGYEETQPVEAKAGDEATSKSALHARDTRSTRPLRALTNPPVELDEQSPEEFNGGRRFGPRGASGEKRDADIATDPIGQPAMKDPSAIDGSSRTTPPLGMRALASFGAPVPDAAKRSGLAHADTLPPVMRAEISEDGVVKLVAKDQATTEAKPSESDEAADK